MTAHPLEALTIARDAAAEWKGRKDLRDKVFEKAARIQEASLRLLNKEQVMELADLYAKTLHNLDAAKRVQRTWLENRENAPGSNDGPGCLELAQLYLKWLANREKAAELCRKALRIKPDLTAAEEMLRNDLNHRLTKNDWVPSESMKPEDRLRNALGVQPGDSPDKVRNHLGTPSRTARQILLGRYREQWYYDEPRGLQIEFECFKGKLPVVLIVHKPADTKP
jgi:hypothetical protein